jgi:hypothetical protein
LIEAGDEIWIVGEKRRLLTIKRAQEAARVKEASDQGVKE